MSKVIGITGLGTLQAGSPNLTTKQVNAHGKLITWIQDVAEGIIKEEGKVLNSAELRSQGYFNAYLKAITEYTPFVTITSDQSVQISKSTHSGNINIGQILDTAIEVYVTGEALATYKALNDLFANPNTKVTDFADFWWEHNKHSSTNTAIKHGPVVPVENGDSVEFTVLFASLSESVNDWRTLFISSHFESVDVYTIGLTFRYTNQAWRQFGPQIEKRLDPKVTSSIKSAPLGV